MTTFRLSRSARTAVSLSELTVLLGNPPYRGCSGAAADLGSGRLRRANKYHALIDGSPLTATAWASDLRLVGVAMSQEGGSVLC